jgi:hypothetical protein
MAATVIEDRSPSEASWTRPRGGEHSSSEGSTSPSEEPWATIDTNVQEQQLRCANPTADLSTHRGETAHFSDNRLPVSGSSPTITQPYARRKWGKRLFLTIRSSAPSHHHFRKPQGGDSSGFGRKKKGRPRSLPFQVNSEAGYAVALSGLPAAEGRTRKRSMLIFRVRSILRKSPRSSGAAKVDATP